MGEGDGFAFGGGIIWFAFGVGFFLSGLLAFLLLIAYGVWCLFSYWFISVPPVRGAPTFLCLPQRKVGKRKRLQPPTFKCISLDLI
ncbi:hypothetical protein [Paraburkholderia fungorum]|uniref:hypothetical protein n=1 Tax=Paraburkholderia fungorum TaxID=134537 RepID=UPI0038B7237D